MNSTVYSRYFQLSTRRCLSFLNRDPNSDSFGSFDRYFWGWKKRDFPDSTLQFAVVPLLYCLPPNESAPLLGAAFENLRGLMRSNGSCDQSYPYENHPKIFLDVIEVCIAVAQNAAGHFSTRQVALAREMIQRGVDFSLRDEPYAFIANHVAAEAFQYLNAARSLGSSRYYDYGVKEIRRIAAHTNAEGWHQEYLGGDPGYQSRALRYLTKCIGLLDGADKPICESLCERSALFLDKVVLPDGTLYGMFGSRNTAILYTSGIEYMAKNFGSRFAPLARRVRESVEAERAILPLQLEFDNFIRLFDDFVDSDRTASSLPETVCPPPRASIELGNFGFRAVPIGDEHTLFLHTRFGGALSLYRGEQCLYREAGILLDDRKTDRSYGTRNLHAPSQSEMDEAGTISIRTELFRSRQEDLTPFKLVVIRLLNFTFLRFSWIGDWFRKCVVARLIVGTRERSSGNVVRKVRLSPEAIQIEDHFTLSFTPKRVVRSPSLHLFHMASSRHWHPVEATQAIPVEETFAVGKSFSLTKELRIQPSGGAESKPSTHLV